MSRLKKGETEMILWLIAFFYYNVATEIMQQNEDHEPKSVDECRHRND